MKTKVLIWRASNGGSAEAMLNDWLADHSEYIKIDHVTQSEAGSHTSDYRITYTIWYTVDQK